MRRRRGDALDVNLVSAKARAALALRRFRFRTEADLHEGIAKALDLGRLHFEREYRLGGSRRVSVGDGRGLVYAQSDEREPTGGPPSLGRLDFFVEECLALEVKIAGSWADLYRQVCRYAEDPEVLGVLVVTSRLHLNDFHGTTINQKPVSVYRIPPEL